MTSTLDPFTYFQDSYPGSSPNGVQPYDPVAQGGYQQQAYQDPAAQAGYAQPGYDAGAYAAPGYPAGEDQGHTREKRETFGQGGKQERTAGSKQVERIGR